MQKRLNPVFASGLVIATISLALWMHRAPAVAQSAGVRLALVNVPDELLRPLIPGFQEQTGRTADIVYTGRDPFGVARQGKADLVISHYGHEGVQPFMAAGLGLWPHPVFANQMALLGPPGDPAKVRGLRDAAEALKRIAQTKSTFIVNSGAGARYVEEILFAAIGDPAKGDWYVNPKVQGPAAARAAADRGGYVLWGLPPFLRLKRRGPIDLEPLVVADPLLQRIMVSIVVNPEKTRGTNLDAAKAFQDYLMAPATQAKIRAFRYPDFAEQAWWPAGRHNSAVE